MVIVVVVVVEVVVEVLVVVQIEVVDAAEVTVLRFSTI